jgi:MarR family transcriptional regulator, temperature-dependent positive regulator of motility
MISAADQGGPPGHRAPGAPSFLDSTWYLLARTGSLAYQHWAAMIADFAVSPSQYKVLMTLGETGPLGQQRLAELISIDPRNTVPIVESLVERGLIERAVDPADRRRRMLELTRAGRGIARALASIGAEIEQDILRPLSQADQARLRQMMLEILGAPAG